MQCAVCNIIIEEDGDVSYCDDFDVHYGGYACEDCCDDAVRHDPCPMCNYVDCQCDAMYDSYKDSLLDRY